MNEIVNPISRLTNVYSSHWYQRFVKEVEPFNRCFGLNVCGYTLVHEDGRYFQMFNFPEICEYFYDVKHHLKDPFNFHPNNYVSGVILPYSLGLQSYNEPHEDLHAKFDVDPNYLIIQRKNGKFAHCFDFTSTRKDISLNQTYMRNLRLIERYVDHFLEEWDPEGGLFDPFSLNIAELMGSRFYKDYKEQIYKSSDPASNSREFLKIFELSGNEQELYQSLSKREKQCLHLLLAGYRANEIAYEINLSPRTVEQHLDNVRLKLNCETRFEVFRRYYELKMLGMLTE